MPLIIAKATIAHAASKHPVMMGLNSPDSSMEFVMFRAFRNQKYDVGEECAHSFTVNKNNIKTKDLRSAFPEHRFCTCVIGRYVSRASFPRQRILKRIPHVEQAPRYDDIVVKSHIKADLKERKTFSLVHNNISRN